MAKDYLLELGLEEIPARFLTDLSKQLMERFTDFLADNRLNFEEVQAYATPRRLAVLVKGIDEVQADSSEKVKGPSLKVAKTAEGEWSKAAQGFVRGQGLSTDDIFVEAIKGEDYIFVEKKSQGQDLKTVLANVADIFDAMTFPVSMTWHTYHKAFIRPVHWIVSLLEDEVVPFSFAEVNAGRLSRGHRFLGKEVAIESSATYVEQLRQQFVLVDAAERKAVIRQQLEALAEANNWLVPIDEALLEEVTSIVEWPTAFYGEFEAEYLEIPQIVSITAMKDHQRYFYALDKDSGKLLPYFISVRNGDSNQLDNVVRGNKKVLKARLEDALFFYKEDSKHDLAYFVEKLQGVKEHFKLGTLADKQARVIRLIEQLTLADATALITAKEAAAVYKFDLMTQVVNEFDELQGQMGVIYGEQFGLDQAVAQAIGDQYKPTSSGGELPLTEAGAILALVDKLDTLLNYFNVGLVPTGSNDPYALRRQAMGVVEIILANQWSVDLEEILAQAQQVLALQSDNLVELTLNFIKQRHQQYLEKVGLEYDMIQAALKNRGGQLCLSTAFVLQLHALKVADAVTYRKVVEALTRVVNLGAKQYEEVIDTDIDTTLTQTDSESALVSAVESIQAAGTLSIDDLADLAVMIEAYFDHNMVNDANDTIRVNRLKTLKALTDVVLIYLDPRELTSKF